MELPGPETVVAPETTADPQDSAPLSQGGRALAEVQARLRTGLLGAPSTGDLRWAGTELGLAAVCGPGSRGWGGRPWATRGVGGAGARSGSSGAKLSALRPPPPRCRPGTPRPQLQVLPLAAPRPPRGSPRRSALPSPCRNPSSQPQREEPFKRLISAAASAKSSSGSLLGLQ